jgi:hypothetical protein
MTFSPFYELFISFNDTPKIKKLKSLKNNRTFGIGSIEPIDAGLHLDE